MPTTQDRKTLLLTVASMIFGALLQAASFGYFFGKLTQKVEDLKEKVDGLIEHKYEVKR